MLATRGPFRHLQVRHGKKGYSQSKNGWGITPIGTFLFESLQADLLQFSSSPSCYFCCYVCVLCTDSILILLFLFMTLFLKFLVPWHLRASGFLLVCGRRETWFLRWVRRSPGWKVTLREFVIMCLAQSCHLRCRLVMLFYNSASFLQKVSLKSLSSWFISSLSLLICLTLTCSLQLL